MLTYCRTLLTVIFDNLWKVIVLFSLSFVTGQKNKNTRNPIGKFNQKKYDVFSTKQKHTKTTRQLANARFPASFPGLGRD